MASVKVLVVPEQLNSLYRTYAQVKSYWMHSLEIHIASSPPAVRKPKCCISRRKYYVLHEGCHFPRSPLLRPYRIDGTDWAEMFNVFNMGHHHREGSLQYRNMRKNGIAISESFSGIPTQIIGTI